MYYFIIKYMAHVFLFACIWLQQLLIDPFSIHGEDFWSECDL